MAKYTKVFDNPYPNGWEDLPSENTPITASALQEHTDAIEHIEQYLEDNPINDATDVKWNQLVTDGTKIAEITIDGEKTDVYAKGGGGGGTSFEVGNELNLENDVLSYKANFGTTSEFETFKQDESVPIGATYHVTDDFVEGGGEIYSTDEVICGKWINGETLYRKVFIITNPIKNSYVLWSDLPSSANIMKCDSIARTTGSNVLQLPWLNSGETTFAYVTFDKKLYYYTVMATELICILEYTK